MASSTAANTKRMFVVSVACVILAEVKRYGQPGDDARNLLKHTVDKCIDVPDLFA